MQARLVIFCAIAFSADPALRAEPPVLSVANVDGRVVGFDLAAGGKVIAPVRLSSNGLITADKAGSLDGGRGLWLSGLRAKASTGLELGAEDYIEIRLDPADPYPEVRFRLTVARFDPAQWERGAGKFPFHFLCVSLPEAEAVHQRGWLNATPKADPFPFLLDEHVGTPEICSNWSRNWSYVVPIGAYPIPVAGLWAPRQGRYVGYDFMDSRLAEQSERYLATAYCWQQGDERQFVALAYPYAGKGFQTLTYPQPGAVIAGRFRLVTSTAMPATADPNTLLQEYYFRKHADRLPRVPAMSNLGWMPGGARLARPLHAPGTHLVDRVGEGATFEEPGTVEIGAWTWHRESAVFSAYRRGDTRAIERLKADLAYLISKAERVAIDGQQCIFWPKPIEGRWRDRWGGAPVKTLHNANGWAAGMALVDLYRHDRTAEYLPLVDGVYNWTRHFVWTRNEFADVPSSPFAIGGTLSAAFLLSYHYAFRDDPARADRAREALELARRITYRYMPIWAADSDRDDNLDPSFLWEPNSGRDWTGTACANEVHWNLDTLTQVYVSSGDPILLYYLRGSLARWHLLYKEILADSIADYSHEALSEWLGLFDGTMAGRGGRASFGTGDSLPMNWPVGQSVLRVTCGCRAAVACAKASPQWSIDEYRYGPPTSFSFKLHSRQPGPLDVTLSFPFADLTDQPVTLVRQGKSEKLPSARLLRTPTAPSYIYVRALLDGDRLTVGQVPPDAPVLAIETPWTFRPARDEELTDRPFRMLRLADPKKLPYDWAENESYAGLWPGKHWAWAVPFYVEGTADTTEPMAADTPCQIELPAGTAAAYVFFSPKGEGGTLQLSVGQQPGASLSEDGCAVAWQSWPPCFHRRVLVARVCAPLSRSGRGAGGEGTRPILSIIPKNAWLVAATVLLDATDQTRVDGVLQRGNAEFRELLAAERRIAATRRVVADVPDGRIAVLPIGETSGPAITALQATGLWKKCQRLGPAKMLDRPFFTAKTFPVLLNVGGEGYLGTIHREGDGAEAILDYLRSGGTLVMLTSQPLPFCYDGLEHHTVGRPLTPRMGMPIRNVFENPPEGERLRMVLNPAQRLLTDLPAEIPFPSDGDLRLRSVHREQVSRDARYTPILSVIGSGGKVYGDAIAEARFERGPFAGARLVYVWSRLSADKQLGPQILDQLIRLIAAEAKRKGMRGCRKVIEPQINTDEHG